MGLPLRSPVAKLSCEAATEENATCQELSQLRESFGATEFASKEWSDSHGNANQAQSKSESVKNGADDDEVFSNKGVEIDLIWVAELLGHWRSLQTSASLRIDVFLTPEVQ